MARVTVSVIIPIYKGDQYISYWVDKIGRNVDAIRNTEVELLFINDYPDVALEEVNEPITFYTKVINSGINRGIHGARVFGLEHAKGDYIVFLDQDDKISDNYLVTQLASIGDSDVVIANGLNEHYCCAGKDVIYADEIAHKNACSLEVMLGCGNTIISPGHTMIRKKSIPEMWKRNILKNNGADDYFLWLIMLSQGKIFVINREIIYTHVATGSNLSLVDEFMNASLREMIFYLGEEKVIADDELRKIEGRIGTSNRRAIINRLYDRWLHAVTHGQNTGDYFKAHDYNKVAIYGMHQIGGRLYTILKNEGIEVSFGIDKNAARYVYDIPLFIPDDAKLNCFVNEVDAVVVTIAKGFDEVKRMLLQRGYKVIISIDDVINYLIDGIQN